MDAKDLAFDYGADTEIIENLSAVLPWVGISVLSDCLIVEAVDSGDLPGLVVASEESDVRRVLEFEAQKKLEGLNRVVTAVHEITHENVSSVWDLSAFVEKFKQVVELTMDISADGDRCAYWLHVTLLDQNFLDFFAENAQVTLRKDTASLDCVQPSVDVYMRCHI